MEPRDCVGLGYAVRSNDGGSDQTNLTDDPGLDTRPDWSPDGSRIAFDSDRSGIFSIRVMNADGSDQTNLTSRRGDHAPDWSPDGSRIAFYTARGPDFEIYIMNADGSGQTNLTNNPGDDKFPAWTPEP